MKFSWNIKSVNGILVDTRWQSNMAGWEIPDLNGHWNGNIISRCEISLCHVWLPKGICNVINIFIIRYFSAIWYLVVWGVCCETSLVYHLSWLTYWSWYTIYLWWIQPKIVGIHGIWYTDFARIWMIWYIFKIVCFLDIFGVWKLHISYTP